MRPGRLLHWQSGSGWHCWLLACLLTVTSVLCVHYLSGMGLSFALGLLRNLAPLDKENVSPTMTPPLPEAASPCLLPPVDV